MDSKASFVSLSWSTSFLNGSLKSSKRQSAKTPIPITCEALLTYILYIGFSFQPLKKVWNPPTTNMCCLTPHLSFSPSPLPNCSNSSWIERTYREAESTLGRGKGPSTTWPSPGQSSHSILSGNDWFRDGHMTSEGVVRVNLRICADNRGPVIFPLCSPWMKTSSPREQLEAVWNKGCAEVCLQWNNTGEASEPRNKWWRGDWFPVELFEPVLKFFKSFWTFQLREPVNSPYNLS